MGLSNSAAARLERHSGFNWCKKLGAGAQVAALPELRLLPIEIKMDESDERTEARQSPSVLEIILPCGSHLRCNTGMDPALLGQALIALRPGASGSVA